MRLEAKDVFAFGDKPEDSVELTEHPFRTLFALGEQ